MITLEELSEFVRKGKNAQAEIDKLCRTKDPQTSKDAAKRMVESGALDKQHQWVYDHIHSYIRQRALNQLSLDFTTKDIARFVGPYDKVNDICRRRFSGLVNKGKIELVYRYEGKEPFCQRRDGCRVFRLL